MKNSKDESYSESSLNFKDSVERNNFFNQLEQEVFEQMQNEFMCMSFSENDSQNNVSTSNP
jgi:hypothetical protein